jgi:hypothetical protein
VIVKRRVDERARRHVERIEQFDAAPRADAIAVLAPAVVQDVGLRRQRPQRRTQALAEREVLQVEAELDRKPSAVRPVVGIALMNRLIAEAAMCCQ